MSFKVKDEGSRATVYIYGAIGEDYWDPESATRAREFSQLLDGLSPKPVDIRIDSCGGDVYEGFAIASAIQRYEGETAAHIDGIAASAASYIALSADRVAMNDFAWIMIHNAWTFASGNRDDLRAAAEQLEGVDASIAKIISARSSLSPEEVAEAMAAETWYTAEDAERAGMCDEIVETSGRVEARIDGRVAARFRNMPQGVFAEGNPDDRGGAGAAEGTAITPEDGSSHTEATIEDKEGGEPGTAFVIGSRVFTRKEK